MKTAPDPKDVQEFLFKQSTTYQICDGFTSVPTSCSLVIPDKKRGILYIGHGNSITVLKPKEDVNPEWKVQIDLQTTISIIALSCDCSYLAVASNGPVVFIYDAHSLARNTLQLLHELRTSTSSADAYIRDLKWNPSIAGMLCTISSDHTIGSFHIKDEKERTVGLNALERPDGLDACCAAWSPKGKQIVVGCKNGSIVQLKPDLKAARTIPGPEPYMGEVIAILWISNYQFCAAYLGTEQRVNVLIVDAPKGDTNAIFTCYEDITYGMPEGDVGVPRYYFEYIPEWSVIVAASSVSSEIAVLGSSDNGSTWSQWQLIDSGRAQLPLIRTTEVYPVGLAIDRSPVNKLPWGADATLPNPVPVLHIFGTSGQLCSFHVVNLAPNCPTINFAPTEIVPKQVEISFSMNSVTTSTPRPKHVENLVERPKEPPIANIFGDSLKVAGFFRPQEPEKVKVPESKPVSGNVEVPNVAVKKVVAQETVKVDVKSMETKQEVERKTNVDESICARAYFEEVNAFEKELRSRLEPQSWECGTAEEKKQLGERATLIDQFLRDLKETTNSLSSDIAYLKALLLQSFAWVEETKSKNAVSVDLNTRPYCDGNKISDLLQLYCYTQAQLDQATKILDLEWSEQKFQESSRMKIPSLEFVYQNLVLHSKIITKERARVDSLKKKWMSLLRSNNITALSRSMSNMHVASPKSCRRENSGIIEARCKTVAWKTLSFTQTKMLRLKGLLSESTPKVVRPANPSPIQDRLEATLSSLAHLSAMADDKIGKRDNIAKQNLVNRKMSEKAKGQSPLDSLNSIVAKIGSPELGDQKAQVKSPSSNTTFSTKLSQSEKKSNSPATSTTTRAKQKQEPIFGQVNPSSQNFPGLQQSFPKIDSITFGTTTPKQDNTSQKPRLKENLDKISKESGNGEIFKAEAPAFPSKEDFLSGKTQLVKQNASPSLTTVSKSDISTTFTFTTPGVAITSTKNSLREAAQTFSFASNSPNSFSFALKTPPGVTQPQTQGSLSLGGLGWGFQGSTEQQMRPNAQNLEGKSSDKESKSSTLDFQQSLTSELVQKVSNMSGISISVVNGASGTTNASSDESKLPTFEKNVQPAATGSIFGNQSGVLTGSMFGGTSMNTTVIPAGTTTTSAQVSPASVPVFSGFSASTLTLTPTTTSFQTTSTKPTYPEQPTTFSVTSSDPPSVSFGSALPTETSVSPVFDKPAASPLSTSNGFPTSSAPSSTTSTFDKPIHSTSTPFSSTPASGSIFGGTPTSFSTNIFGSITPSSSIFGGNSSTMGSFGATSPTSPFDGAQKSSSIFGGATTTGGSFFGGSNAAVPVSESVFSTSSTGLSPMGVGSAQSVFGQAPTFGSKPVFGSPPPLFGSQVFGGGFGTTAFGGTTAGTTGFGGSPPLAATPPMENPMPGVFGESSGSTTFETLGSQSGGLTFGSLAQKSPEPDKPPVFAGGSSFSSWR